MAEVVDNTMLKLHTISNFGIFMNASLRFHARPGVIDCVELYTDHQFAVTARNGPL